jgi:hypothetical protein
VRQDCIHLGDGGHLGVDERPGLDDSLGQSLGVCVIPARPGAPYGSNAGQTRTVETVIGGVTRVDRFGQLRRSSTIEDVDEEVSNAH